MKDNTPLAWLREEYNGTGQRSVQLEAPPAELPLRERAIGVRYTPLYTRCHKFATCQAVGEHGYDIPNVTCSDFGCSGAHGVTRCDDLARIANLSGAARREAMYRESDPLCFVCSGTRMHPREAETPCPNCADNETGDA